MTKSFDELIAKLDGCPLKKVSVAVAQDAHVLEAVKVAKERNIADAILVGDADQIKEIADSINMDLSSYEVIDIKDMNPEIYRRYTGGDARLVRENLTFLLENVGPERLLVRVPLIPEFNTQNDCDESERLLRQMGVTRIERFSYIRREVVSP